MFFRCSNLMGKWLSLVALGIGLQWIGFPVAVQSQDRAAESESQPSDRSGQSGAGAATEQGDSNGNAGEREAETRRSERSPGGNADTPALGVVIGACPANAVCVHEVAWDSPAAQAGIQPGDYILKIDGQSVNSPRELVRHLQTRDSDRALKLTVWRDGQQFDEEIRPAMEASELPAGHRAWLGVVLSPDDNNRVTIEEVVNDSPAARAGLRPGDQILRLNNEPVQDMESFVDRVAEFGPGKTLELSIRRDDREQSIEAELENLNTAPLYFVRHVYRRDGFDRPTTDQSDRIDTDPALFDAALDEMRQEIRSLAKELRELRAARRDSAQSDNQLGPQDNRTPQDDPAQRQTAPDEESPGLDANSGDISLPLQRQKVAPEAISIAKASLANLLLNQIGESGQFGNQLAQVNSSRWGRARNRGSYGWRGNNRSLFRNYSSPYYSPRSGYSYYRYGGQPYYYGNRFGYGPRSGIQLGPNFGLCWY